MVDSTHILVVDDESDILELIRYHHVQVEQDDLFSEIWVAEKKQPADQPLRIADDLTDQVA